MLAGKKRLIPEDLFVKQWSHCVNAMLAKIFVLDVLKVIHHPASITMNEFSDCYDWAARTIQSVALSAHSIPKPVVKMMLLSLELMQFFFRKWALGSLLNCVVALWIILPLD